MDSTLEALLKQIERNTRPKQSFQLVEESNKSDFTTNYGTPIKLDGKFEVALVNLETYYSFPNIDSSNNKLKYSHDSGVTWHTILIPEGSYELDDINQAIEQQMKQNNHYDKVHNQSFIKLSPNTSTLKSIMEISGNYKVDFREDNSINILLGFADKVYHAGYHESENIVNILTLNSILVELGIINGSYVKGSRKPVIYSFFPNVSPGYK
jgi:hypothetical protein